MDFITSFLSEIDSDMLYYTVTKLSTGLRYLASYHEILKCCWDPSHDSKIFVLQFVFNPWTRKTMENLKELETSTNKSGGLSYSNDLWASYKVRILWCSISLVGNIWRTRQAGSCVDLCLPLWFLWLPFSKLTTELCKLDTLGRSELD